MLTLPGFDQYSLAYGAKYDRTFVIYDVRGIIADYVLGECGAPGSPLPADFFTRIKIADNAVELLSEDENRRLFVTQDRLFYTQRTKSPSDQLSDTERKGIYGIVEKLFPDLLRFLKEPNLHFIGIVWEYARHFQTNRQRFGHPAADFLTKKIVRLELDTKEFPAEMNTRLAFRRKLQDSVLQKGLNDYINIILTMRDETARTLWPSDQTFADESADDPPRVAIVSLDAQRVFDPRSRYRAGMLESHLEYCERSVAPRVSTLLRELQVAPEAKK